MNLHQDDPANALRRRSDGSRFVDDLSRLLEVLVNNDSVHPAGALRGSAICRGGTALRQI